MTSTFSPAAHELGNILPAQATMEQASGDAGAHGAAPGGVADVANGDEAGTTLPPVGSGVVDAEGLFGTVVSHHALQSDAQGLSNMLVVRHREHQVMLPAGLFQAISTTSFRIPFAFSALVASSGGDGKLVLPVLQEEMTVSTRVVETGRGVRVHKTVVETPHEIERSLMQDQFTIEHVQQGRLLDAGNLPEARYEGETFVIPVIEEVLVVQTQLRLKEEIRITRATQTVVGKQTVYLKSQQVEVQRFDENAGLEQRLTATDTIGTPSGMQQGDASITGRL